jgi:hypothetical protein
VGRKGWQFSFRGEHQDQAAVTDGAGDPCARGIRCEERDYQGNARCGPRTFCETDSRYIRRAITDLPRTYIEVRTLLARTEQAGERVSGSREPPMPLAADVQEFMREILLIACSWEEVVRTAARSSDYPDGRRRDSVQLAAACKTLDINFEALLNLGPCDLVRPATRRRVDQVIEEHGDETGSNLIRYDTSGDAWENVTLDGTAAALEFLALNGRARGMLGISRQRRRITEVPCDDCKAKTLVQYEARDGGWDPVVKCTNCPNVYSGPRYELLMGRAYQVQLESLGKAS